MRSSRTCWAKGLLLALLLGAAPARAATPALIQNASNQDCTATTHATLAAAFAATVGVGNTVVGYTFWSPGTNGSPTVTDDKANTYTVQDVAYDGHVESHSFYAVNLTNAPKTVTVTFPGAEGFATVSISEFSNISAFDIGHAGTQATPGTGTDAITSGGAITTANGDLVYGATSTFFGQITLAHGTGFTDADNPSATAGCSYASEYEVQSAAGSIAATFTAATAPSGSETHMLSFKATAASTSSRTLLGVGQ